MENVKLIIGKEYVPNITPLFDSAKNTLDIVAYDFRLYPDQIGGLPFQLLESLKSALRRGVKIRIITMRLESCEPLKALGFSAKHWQTGKTLHAKFFVADNSIAVLGSHNYTNNALTLNHEVSVIVNCAAFAAELQNYFNDLWSSS